jgi:hypothetical protein
MGATIQVPLFEKEGLGGILLDKSSSIPWVSVMFYKVLARQAPSLVVQPVVIP